MKKAAIKDFPHKNKEVGLFTIDLFTLLIRAFNTNSLANFPLTAIF